MRSMRKVVGLVAVLGLAVGLARAEEGQHSDTWITMKTRLKLLTTDGAGGMAVKVETKDGVVTLHGSVGTAAERSRADEVARQVGGVKSVKNLVQVVPEARKTAVQAHDSEIKDKVKKRLEAHPELKDVSVTSVDKGVVLLTGKTDTLRQALEAVEVVADVPGVRTISNQITIREEEKHGATPRRRDDVPAVAKAEHRPERPDSWVTTKTKIVLLTTPDVSGTEIHVDTHQGQVTLEGQVPSSQEKTRAEEVTRGIAGVKDVHNLLRVVPAARKDAVDARDDQIQAGIEKAFERDPDLDGIKVRTVDAGAVVLDGKTTNLRQALRAIETARAVPGVQSVADQIQVEKEKK
jgi:hyperosmotically inducible protein